MHTLNSLADCNVICKIIHFHDGNRIGMTCDEVDDMHMDLKICSNRWAELQFVYLHWTKKHHKLNITENPWPLNKQPPSNAQQSTQCWWNLIGWVVSFQSGRRSRKNPTIIWTISWAISMKYTCWLMLEIYKDHWACGLCRSITSQEHRWPPRLSCVIHTEKAAGFEGPRMTLVKMAGTVKYKNFYNFDKKQKCPWGLSVIPHHIDFLTNAAWHTLAPVFFRGLRVFPVYKNIPTSGLLLLMVSMHLT